MGKIKIPIEIRFWVRHWWSTIGQFMGFQNKWLTNLPNPHQNVHLEC